MEKFVGVHRRGRSAANLMVGSRQECDFLGTAYEFEQVGGQVSGRPVARMGRAEFHGFVDEVVGPAVHSTQPQEGHSHGRALVFELSSPSVDLHAVQALERCSGPPRETAFEQLLGAGRAVFGSVERVARRSGEPVHVHTGVVHVQSVPDGTIAFVAQFEAVDRT
nr:hypothetical protein [Lentzea jiangxiensis]